MEDQPPEWVSVAAVTRIPEDIPLFSPVGSETPYNYVRSTPIISESIYSKIDTFS